mmetsp:Transcript_61045/g.98764  ORF Transcript_61045/g.98764 Transcript_61045/m.98764 type:complete len:86 (+) Transcript_61045:52-309(+)
MADPSKRAGDATPLSMCRGLMVVLTLAQIIPAAFGFHTSAVFHPGYGRTGREDKKEKRLFAEGGSSTAVGSGTSTRPVSGRKSGR